jgi:hypothetical protein
MRVLATLSLVVLSTFGSLADCAQGAATKSKNCNRFGVCYGQKKIICNNQGKGGCVSGAWYPEPISGRTCYPHKYPRITKYWCVGGYGS